MQNTFQILYGHNVYIIVYRKHKRQAESHQIADIYVDLNQQRVDGFECCSNQSRHKMYERIRYNNILCIVCIVIPNWVPTFANTANARQRLCPPEQRQFINTQFNMQNLNPMLFAAGWMLAIPSGGRQLILLPSSVRPFGQMHINSR